MISNSFQEFVDPFQVIRATVGEELSQIIPDMIKLIHQAVDWCFLEQKITDGVELKGLPHADDYFLENVIEFHQIYLKFRLAVFLPS